MEVEVAFTEDDEADWEDEEWEEEADWEDDEVEEETVPETPPPQKTADTSERREPAGDTPASTLDSVASSVLSQVYVPFDFGRPPPRPLKFYRDFKISKRLSASLRHDKGDFNLDFRKNMAAPLRQLLAHRIMTEVGVTQAEIIAAVYHNEKQRFRLLWEGGPDGELLIGAVQGHSMVVDNASVHCRVDPDKVPYLTHATHYDFYRNIARPRGSGYTSIVDLPKSKKFFDLVSCHHISLT